MLERLTKGKQAELYVFGELLRRGMVPYVPMVDMEGIDAVIRGARGYLELQIKSTATLKSPRWFQVGRLTPKEGCFLVCVNLTVVPPETWIIPSEEFHRYATRSTDSKGRTTHDLDLDSASHQDPVQKRGQMLSPYLEAWHLLTGASKSLLTDTSEWSELSEPALGEEWSSPEDQKYDEL